MRGAKRFWGATALLGLAAACSADEGAKSAPTGAGGTSSGASGASGAAGVSGASGTSGDSGSSGAAGTSGSSGSAGAAGASGASGASGADGGSGAAGASSGGTSGDAGTSGAGGSGGGSVDAGPPPNDSPIEPVWQYYSAAARVKSPAQRMRYTAGQPFRILADASDPNAWQCPPGSPPYVCPDSSMTFYVDGAEVGTVAPNPSNQNLWELRLPRGLSAGNHVVTVKFKPHSAAAIDGAVPVYITVDPEPSRQRRVELSADLVLSGSTDLDWTNAVVVGNGHRVRSSPGWTGRVLIRDSWVTGLARFDSQIGIDVATTGSVEITGSIFEATAPLRLVANGNASLTISNNEFRSTNYVTFVSADPSKSPILEISGSASGTKRFQGNRVGAGIVRFSGMTGWQIGGLRDAEGNVFMGPRCVLELDDSPNATLQGNYLRHDYHGGFSQGFNLDVGGSRASALAEHNVIRGGSWPLQGFGGEFRYNLMIESGHDFVRSSRSGAQYHHNVFVHAQAPNSGYDGGLLFYGGEKDLVFDHNTIDAGGRVGAYDAPALVLGNAGVSFASVRHNVFAHFSGVSGRWPSRALLSAGDGEANVSAARIRVADHNAWWNPLAPQVVRYMPGLVAGAVGAGDVLTDPRFTGREPQTPYSIDEGAVWERRYGVSQVLEHYRAQYTPGAGSPLVDAASTPGADIGAIGAGAADALDRFGKVLAR